MPIPSTKILGKMTMPNAGTMAYRRNLLSTTRIYSTERGTVKNRVSGVAFLAWHYRNTSIPAERGADATADIASMGSHRIDLG